jgi:Flp pilus assembly protein TadD
MNQLVLEQAVRVAPRYGRAHYALGVLHAAAGRTDAAAECLASAARLAGAAGSAQVDDSALSSSDGGGDDDALLVPVAPAQGEDELVHSEFGYLLALGKVRVEQGRHAAASKVFELALKLKPLASSGWVALGATRHRLGEADRALSAFETAVRPPQKALNPSLRFKGIDDQSSA